MMDFNLGNLFELILLAAIGLAVVWFVRKSSAEREALVKKAAGSAEEALRDLAAKAIDKLHDSVPASKAAIAAPITPPVPASPSTDIPSASQEAPIVKAVAPVSIPVATANDLPGMTTVEKAATRLATDADMRAAVPAGEGSNVWPRTWILADGAGTRVLAKAPLSPLYRTSQMGQIMGKPLPGGGGGHAVDPANGDEASPPMPLRSAAGFPIRYSIVNGVVVGTPSVMWGEHAFNSDAEVLEYIRRTMKAAEGAAARQKAAEGVAEWTGEEDPATLWKQPGDLGYPTREAMYAARVPWLYKREQAKQLKEYGFNAANPYVGNP